MVQLIVNKINEDVVDSAHLYKYFIVVHKALYLTKVSHMEYILISALLTERQKLGPHIFL